MPLSSNINNDCNWNILPLMYIKIMGRNYPLWKVTLCTEMTARKNMLYSRGEGLNLQVESSLNTAAGIYTLP